MLSFQTIQGKPYSIRCCYIGDLRVLYTIGRPRVHYIGDPQVRYIGDPRVRYISDLRVHYIVDIFCVRKMMLFNCFIVHWEVFIIVILMRVSCNNDIVLDLNFMSCAKTTHLVAKIPIFAYFYFLTTYGEVTMLASLDKLWGSLETFKNNFCIHQDIHRHIKTYIDERRGCGPSDQKCLVGVAPTPIISIRVL